MYRILLTCSLTVVLVSGQRFSKSIQAQHRVGYSSNVVHTYPGVNDLHAESSVNVNFQQQASAQYNPYSQSPISNEVKKSNAFNVGYDLSFNEDSYRTKKQEPRYTSVSSQKFQNAEVITGRLKKNEKVRAPGANSNILSPQDYVSNAFQKQKQLNRYTSSSTNTRDPNANKLSQFPSQSPNFTFKTQQNIFKDVIRATRPEPSQLRPDFRATYKTHLTNNHDDYLGQSRGPKYNNVAAPERSNFNHEFALKNSESFDFSNAHGEIKIGDDADSSQAASEQYIKKVRADNDAPGHNNVDINTLNIEAHIPEKLRGRKPLPLDTSLLKDPVLTTTYKEAPKNAQVIPIHFDIRQIQTALQQELSKQQPLTGHQNGYTAQQAETYGYPAQLSSAASDSTYDVHQDQSPTQTSFRTYGQPEAIGTDQYDAGKGYGKRYSNYEEDVYKIVSMRPPPVAQGLNY